MKRSFKLRKDHDENEARKSLADSDVATLRALEKLLLSDTPLSLERESLRETIRRNKSRK